MHVSAAVDTMASWIAGGVKPPKDAPPVADLLMQQYKLSAAIARAHRAAANRYPVALGASASTAQPFASATRSRCPKAVILV